jgi:hypothetical protein
MERRGNIRMASVAPSVRYHPIGRKQILDPAIGLVVPVGRYLFSESGVSNGTYISTFPEPRVFVSPQAELSLNINTNSAFTFQLAVAAGPQFVAGRHTGAYFSLGLLRCGFRF